jgi:hypothetical protein
MFDYFAYNKFNYSYCDMMYYSELIYKIINLHNGY